jgi:hypothetical protein
MKWIKLYEDFKYEQEILEPELDFETETSDKTVDDVLKTDFFENDNKVYQDERGVYHITDWKIY